MKLRHRTLATLAIFLGVLFACNANAAHNGGGRGGGSATGHVAGHSGGFAGSHERFEHRGQFFPRFSAAVFFGTPLLAPYYYPPAPYYPAPAYMPQYPGQFAPQPPSVWFYCPGSNSYYPYVAECPEGWMEIPPQPPS